MAGRLTPVTSVELLQDHLREEPFCQGDIVLVNVSVPRSAVEVPVKALVSLAPNALDEERVRVVGDAGRLVVRELPNRVQRLLLQQEMRDAPPEGLARRPGHKVREQERADGRILRRLVS